MQLGALKYLGSVDIYWLAHAKQPVMLLISSTSPDPPPKADTRKPVDQGYPTTTVLQDSHTSVL